MKPEFKIEMLENGFLVTFTSISSSFLPYQSFHYNQKWSFATIIEAVSFIESAIEEYITNVEAEAEAEAQKARAS